MGGTTMRKTFDQWMKDVATALRAEGLDLRDLPDCPYHDWYEDRVSAKSAAKRAIKNAME